MQRHILAAGFVLAFTLPAHAQSGDDNDGPRRTRVAIGAQVVPSYPGADHNAVRPLFDFASARGSAQFDYEAADESPNVTLYDRDGLEAGIAIGLQSARSAPT